MVFLWGQLFLGPSVLAAEELACPHGGTIVITPVLHRSFNLIGYKIGWKDVTEHGSAPNETSCRAPSGNFHG